MSNIILSQTTQVVPPQPVQNQYPDILTQFTPPLIEKKTDNVITFANVGVNQVIAHPDDPVYQPRQRMFDTITLKKSTGPLIIHGKRWYFRLVVNKNGDYKRARALMDDFTLNEISHHMVVCFTPDRIPGNNKPFRNQDGNPIRIYAFFDSYLEFYEYINKFPATQRAFYEIIFGELPQKPHFDIDIDLAALNAKYPGEDIDTVATILQQAVVSACIDVLAENLTTVDISKDILLYSSHGTEKRSFHLVINNKCHDGNKEASAFYNAVMIKVSAITGGKYLKFVDDSVYSPRQQFRMVGCQKHESNRPKIFHEQFDHGGVQYTHTYTEDVTNPIMKALTTIYESMISFTSGCIFLPSLVPPKQFNQSDLGELPNLDNGIVEYCMKMLREKMPFCPFVIKEVRGHLILLKRNSPSYCPICHPNEFHLKPQKGGSMPHEREHPYMFIVGGKVYWDCRRAPEDAKKFFVGYLAMTIEELQNGMQLPGIQVIEEEPDEGGEFMFGDYNIGVPTLPPQKKEVPVPREGVRQQATAITTLTPLSPPRLMVPAVLQPRLPPLLGNGNPTIIIPPPGQRRQNVEVSSTKIGKEWAANKLSQRRENQNLTGTLASTINNDHLCDGKLLGQDQKLTGALTMLNTKDAWIPGLK